MLSIIEDITRSIQEFLLFCTDGHFWFIFLLVWIFVLIMIIRIYLLFWFHTYFIKLWINHFCLTILILVHPIETIKWLITRLERIIFQMLLGQRLLIKHFTTWFSLTYSLLRLFRWRYFFLLYWLNLLIIIKDDSHIFT